MYTITNVFWKIIEKMNFARELYPMKKNMEVLELNSISDIT